MLIERLFENLALDIEPFAVCDVSPGWRLEMDALEWVTLHFVLQGEGRLEVDGEVQELRPSMLAVVPPGVPHAIASGSTSVHRAVAEDVARRRNGFLSLQAGPSSSDDLRAACGRLQVSLGGGLGFFDLLHEPIVLDFADSERMQAAFEALLEEQRTMALGSGAMMAALMRECLVLVLRRIDEDPNCDLPWLSALDDPRLASAVDSVLKEPEFPHSVDSLAAKAYMSRSAFAQQFASAFGRTPMAFVRDVRLRRGAALLRTTDFTVDAVARRVGFASRSHFSRAFREYFEISPASFRHFGSPTA